MRPEPSTLAVVSLVVLSLLAPACSPDQEAELSAAREASWASLQEMKQGLDDKRRELRELKAQMAEAAPEAEAPAPGGEAASVEGEMAAAAGDLESQLNQLQAEVTGLADEFGGKLVAFINADPPVQGEPLTETQLAAIRMKSDEDMLLAAEYIEKGGDYARAIRIYEDALAVDPDNERLKQELARAEVERFMTKERFAEAKKRMSQDEIRQILGQANLKNIRKYPEKNVEAWFYPKENGGAAGVFFEKNRAGDLVVYQVNFDAVMSPEEGAAEAES